MKDSGSEATGCSKSVTLFIKLKKTFDGIRLRGGQESENNSIKIEIITKADEI